MRTSEKLNVNGFARRNLLFQKFKILKLNNEIKLFVILIKREKFGHFYANLTMNAQKLRGVGRLEVPRQKFSSFRLSEQKPFTYI